MSKKRDETSGDNQEGQNDHKLPEGLILPSFPPLKNSPEIFKIISHFLPPSSPFIFDLGFTHSLPPYTYPSGRIGYGNSGSKPTLLPGRQFPYSPVQRPLGLQQEVSAELDFVAFEAAQVYCFVLELKKRAERMGREVVVVGNKTYGEIAALPVKARLEQQGVQVYSCKVPSSFMGEFRVPETAEMPSELLRRMMADQPVVAVVDGTHSPGQDEHVRYPRAMLGYVNLAASVNEVLGLQTRFGIISDEQLVRLRADTNFNELIASMAQLVPPGTSPLGYEVGFWNPARKRGVLEIFSYTSVHVKEHFAEPLDPQQLSGPAIVLITSTLPADSQLYAGAGLPKKHTPGYFDDRPWRQIEGLEKRLQAAAERYLTS